MRRALANDGRLALSTWRPDEEFALLRRLRGVAERHVGPIADRRHGLGEVNAMALVSMSTGSRELTEEERQRVVADVVADSAEHVRPHMDGAGLAYEIGANVALARA